MKSQVKNFLKTFNIKYPIIQAPMAGASTVDLAAIVTKLGGLGSIPLGSHSESPKIIEEQIAKFQSLLSNANQHSIVNLNFFTHEEPNPKRENLNKEWIEKYKKFYQRLGITCNKTELQLLYPTFQSIKDTNHPTILTLKKLKPKMISFHFGLPDYFVLKSLQESDIKIFVTVTNLEEFKLCLKYEVDGVVLQGWEAGGHRGNFKANDIYDEKLGTFELVRKIVQYVDDEQIKNCPFMIAAGGICDSETIKKLLEYKIAGVQIGTLFLPTEKASISEAHLEKFKSPQQQTIMTASISGRYLRSITTKFLEELDKSPIDTIPEYPLPYDIFKTLVQDTKEIGKICEHSAFLSGSNYHKSWKGTRSVEEVFELLIR